MSALHHTRPFRAVVLDRDGVLTHFDMPKVRELLSPLVPIPIEALGERWRRWCARGSPRALDEEAAFWAGFWDGVADELGLDAEARARLHGFDYTRVLRAFPEARAALAVARARGLAIGVLSNFPLVTLDASLSATGLADLVDVARSAPMLGASKPEPAAYLGVTSALGVEPEDCLFFDDEEECVEGARAVGLHAYLVDRRRSAHALADGVVRDLGALPALLEAGSGAARAGGAR